MAVTNNEVQGVVLALFGASVGGHLDALNDASSINALASDLAPLSSLLVGKDLSSNTAFRSELLTNFGLTSGTTAYSAAQTWMDTNLANGMSRADLVSTAVSFMLALNDSSSPYYAAATAFQSTVTSALAWSTGAGASVFDIATLRAQQGNTGGQGSSFYLTTGTDVLTGTSANDTFEADLAGNDNTLTSGDRIDGGTGTDTLHATLGDASSFATLATIKGIENIVMQAQDIGTAGGDNNISGVPRVDVDFQRVSNWTKGALNIEDNNSRADLIVEDVRIRDDEITKDVTITMRDTDPGDVDFAVYFDQLSLRNTSSSTSQLNLRVLDTYAVAQGLAPLKDSPYGSFTFYFSTDGGTTFTKMVFASDAMQNAQTFAEMVTALQAQADAKFGAGVVSVSQGGTYIVPDSVTGNDVSGVEIKLTANQAIVFDTTRAGSGWLATETVPAVSGLYTSFTTDQTSSTALVTSSIVLDNVGRGSNGGDLIVGGLSTGATSSSKGVQRFEIKVEDDSTLGTITSTNNTLQEVVITNGTTDRPTNAYNPYSANAGDLTVNGHVSGNLLPDGAAHQSSGFGFDDVRLIDGSAMTGDLSFSAQLTAAAVDKYLKLVDTDSNPASDNIDVSYKGGAGNDTMLVVLDSKAVASNSNINVGREDFSFMFDGGAGNDNIQVGISGLTGSGQTWYANQVINDNITINGGDGNDTIRTPGAGNMHINGGNGDDAIYADDTGGQAISALDETGAPVATFSHATWVFNAANANLYDLASNARQTVGSYGAKLTVDYRGLTKTVTVADTADYKLSDLEVNQAIKNAVNNDAVLSKLLVATDGPSGTLVVTSLTDGVRVAGDLSVTLAGPASTDLSTATLTAYNAANGTASTITTVTALASAIGTNLTAISAHYGEVLAQDTTAADIVGANSITVSDNKINGGVGNDVIVLGTTIGTDTAVSTDDSNDTVVYTAAFGNDTVVNFIDGTTDATGFAGLDKLDFTALKGSIAVSGQADVTYATAQTIAQQSIVVQAVMADDGDGVAEVGETFSAAAIKLTLDAATGTLEDTTASNHLFITYSATTNVGTVYTVADGAGDNDTVVTLMGTIDLADTDWADLTVANFA